MDSLEGLQEGFLHDVFRFHCIVYNSQTGVVHGFIIEFIDPELCIPVTCLAGIDDLLMNIYVSVLQNQDFRQKTRKDLKSYNFSKIN